MAKALAEKHDFTLYNADEKVFLHKELASPWQQPAMCRHFDDWDWFFKVGDFEEDELWELVSVGNGLQL